MACASDNADEQLLLFIDCEGTPIQELAAICVDIVSKRVKDVYLQYAKPFPIPNEQSSGGGDTDWYARRYIHGLNRNFLEDCGFDNEEQLKKHFLTWLSQYTINEVYANNPAKECHFLDIPITDVRLPQWSQRSNTLEHSTVIDMKLNLQPIHRTVCNTWFIHNEYRGWHKHNSLGDRARKEYGVHCALFDAAEVLFHVIPDMMTSPEMCAC